MKKCRKNKLEEDLVVGGRISTEISDKLLMDFTVNFAKDIKLACQNATQYPNKLVTHKSPFLFVVAILVVFSGF